MPGAMNLRLPSLIMLNLDWTSVTEASSLEYLRENGKAKLQDTMLSMIKLNEPLAKTAEAYPSVHFLSPLSRMPCIMWKLQCHSCLCYSPQGCPLLDTLRNRNICQPLPGVGGLGKQEEDD